MANPETELQPDLPSPEVRAIQALLYREAVKRTLTLQTLQKYQQYLDYDIKIVCFARCLANIERFSILDQKEIPQEALEELDNIVASIELGDCCFHVETKTLKGKVTLGLRLIHMLALHDENLPLIAFLKECNCDFNAQTLKYGNTPIIRAVQANQTEIVRYLVRVGVETKQRIGETLGFGVLGLACLDDNAEIVKILLTAKDTDVNVCDERGEPLLLRCITKEPPNHVNMLLEAGADPNMSSPKGQTPLLHCASRENTAGVKLMLKYGADVNQANNHHEVPLLKSFQRDDLDTAIALLEAGADPNYRNPEDSDTILLQAAYDGKPDIIEALIKYGGDVNLLNNKLYSAIHIAAWFGYSEVVKMLLDAGSVHDTQTSDKNTPLALAANGGHLEVMKLLSPLGCDVQNKDKDNDTPLHYAAFNGMVEGVELLIESGADPDVCNSSNASVLWYAVYMKHLEVVKRLLARNVKMEISSRGRNPLPSDFDRYFYETERSPLYVAMDRESKDIVKLLLNAGYNVQNETWLLEDDIPEIETQEELLFEIYEFTKTPVKLIAACRNSIRHYLGRNVCQNLEKLDIPRSLKNYLSLSDLLGDVAFYSTGDKKG